jgi:hypothetical protein
MRFLILLPILVFALVGCSKKQTTQPVEQAAATNTTDQAEQPAEQPEEQPAEMVAEQPAEQPDGQPADLSGVQQNLQSQDYNAAVDALGAANMAQMTPEQKKAYQDQLYRSLDFLRQQAEKDARAQEAYQRLGRKMMGR